MVHLSSLHIRRVLNSFRIKCRFTYIVGRSFRPSGGSYAPDIQHMSSSFGGQRGGTQSSEGMQGTGGVRVRNMMAIISQRKSQNF